MPKIFSKPKIIDNYNCSILPVPIIMTVGGACMSISVHYGAQLALSSRSPAVGTGPVPGYQNLYPLHADVLTLCQRWFQVTAMMRQPGI